MSDLKVEAIATVDGIGFRARLAGGAEVQARTLLLATGIVDEIPVLPGFRELYGRGVWHCPYCDGFELRDRPSAVFGRDHRVVGEARALTTLTSELVVFCDGAGLSAEDVAELSRLGVALRRERVSRLEPRPRGLAVICAGSSPLEVAGLFFASACRERSVLAAKLGCRFTTEGLVETNARQATGIPGLWVAGDAARSVLPRDRGRRRGCDGGLRDPQGAVRAGSVLAGPADRPSRAATRSTAAWCCSGTSPHAIG